MTKAKFAPQDYFGLPLAAALDRLAEQAGVIDCARDPRERRPLLSDEGRRWVFIDYRRFGLVRDGDDGDFGPLGFLNRRPVPGAMDAARIAENREWIARRVGGLRRFEGVISPLIEALKSGEILARGFVRGGLKAEQIDPARWHMGWIVTRRDNAARVEFFADITLEDAEITLTGLILAAPEGAAVPQADAPRAAAVSALVAGAMGDPLKPARRRGGGAKSKYDWPALERELGAKLAAEGLPSPGDGQQSRLEIWVRDWFAKCDQYPAESLVREHVVGVIEAHRKALV
ncbi:hypothetical protein [Acidocella sp.]|uniref:hypothetical protein n=1 Tax=Acidocella sp. TaxID=50710 RepID=UPI0026380D29|nr:hypothetical protein [Acidocella sp.]